MTDVNGAGAGAGAAGPVVVVGSATSVVRWGPRPDPEVRVPRCGFHRAMCTLHPPGCALHPDSRHPGPGTGTTALPYVAALSRFSLSADAGSGSTARDEGRGTRADPRGRRGRRYYSAVGDRNKT